MNSNFLEYNGKKIRSMPKQVLKNAEDIITLYTSGVVTDNALGIKVIGIYSDTTYDGNDLVTNQLNNNKPNDINPTVELVGGEAFINKDDEATFWIYSNLTDLEWSGWIGPISFRGIQGIQGEKGLKGDKGDKGDKGVDGVRGNKLFFGTNPSSVSGQLEGDLYLNISTYNLYSYQANEWTFLINTKGVQGEPGVNGRDGVDGLTPYIHEGVWWIGDINTEVVAEGRDGESLDLKSGVWTVGTLPSFNTTEVRDAYIVSDDPTYGYAMYFHGVGGITWTITPWGMGLPGAQGPKGDPGANGQGVIPGGTTGQVLIKASDADYDTTWGSITGEGSMKPSKVVFIDSNRTDEYVEDGTLDRPYKNLRSITGSIVVIAKPAIISRWYTLSEDITFTNCVLIGPGPGIMDPSSMTYKIILNGCITSNLDLPNTEIIGGTHTNMIFRRFLIKQTVPEDESIYRTSMTFTNCTFYGDDNLQQKRLISNGRIVFDNCTIFNGGFRSDDTDTGGIYSSLEFNNCSFPHVSGSSTVVIGSKVPRTIKISGGTINTAIDIEPNHDDIKLYLDNLYIDAYRKPRMAISIDPGLSMTPFVVNVGNIYGPTSTGSPYTDLILQGTNRFRINPIYAEKFVTSTSGTVLLAHNTTTILTGVQTAVELSALTNIPRDFITSLQFTSGTGITFTINDLIGFTGTHCNAGVFEPIAGYSYNIIIWNAGNHGLQGVVREGVQV